MTRFIWLLTTTVALQSTAAPICPPTVSQIAGSREITNYILKTATIGPADRRSVQEFAKDLGESQATVENRYSGSVDIYCGNTFAQAQVVMKNDLILAPAHLLYDKDSCDNPRDVGACSVYRLEKGKFVTYEVSKVEATGYACPDKASTTDRNDWSILRLKTPLPSSVKPYKVSVAPCAREYEPADVVFVGKSSDYGRASVKSMTEAPRHYGRCQMMRGNCADRVQAIETDCDMAKGASGGGIFIGGKQPHLIGVNAAHYKGCPDSKEDQTGPYNHGCWSAAAAPITDELLVRLKSIAKK